MLFINGFRAIGTDSGSALPQCKYTIYAYIYIYIYNMVVSLNGEPQCRPQAIIMIMIPPLQKIPLFFGNHKHIYIYTHTYIYMLYVYIYIKYMHMV